MLVFAGPSIVAARVSAKRACDRSSQDATSESISCNHRSAKDVALEQSRGTMSEIAWSGNTLVHIREVLTLSQTLPSKFVQPALHCPLQCSSTTLLCSY